jgi:hypothetical protein
LVAILARSGLPAGQLGGRAVEPSWTGSGRSWPSTRTCPAVDDPHPSGVPLEVPGMDALASTGLRVVLDGELVAGAERASDL